MKKIYFILLFTFLSSIASSQIVNKKDAKMWQSDLDNLVAQMEQRHVNLYHKVSKQDFNQAVADLRAKIPELSEPAILVGIAKLLAMVGDGHTTFYASNQRKRVFRLYNINLWSFSDGVYAIALPEELRHLFGKKLVAIDETPITEAFKRLSEMTGADNDMEYQYFVPFEMRFAESLQVLGIAKSAEQVTFHFEGGESVTMKSYKLKDWQKLHRYTSNGVYKGEKPPSLRLEFLFATELMMQNLKERRYYWYTHLEEENAIFFQYKRLLEPKKPAHFRRGDR